LEKPDATARKRSPLCGSTVTVDLLLKNGKIVDYGHDVKACALGQASASVIAANVIGTDIADIEKGRAELVAMLKSDGDVPTAPFEELEALLPAKDYKNRHASILLTFDAILESLDEAKQETA